MNTWGQGAVNNTIGWGQGAKNNRLNWGKSQKTSWAGQTNIIGEPIIPTFSNVNSFSFDGIDNYFLVPDTSGLSFGNSTSDSPFSISAWIKPTSTLFRIFSKYQAPNYEYQFDVGSSGELRLYLFDGLAYRARTTPVSAITTGQWSHVAVTYSGVGGTNAQDGIKLYVNGVNIVGTTSSNGSYTAMSNTTAQAYIGKISSSYSSGNIDETAIFTTELSQSDITAIYNNGEPQSLDAYSPFVWFRMGDNATWNGATWTMTSVGTDTRIARSVFMVEANRSTDVPT